MIRQTFLNRYRQEVEQASKDAKDYIQAITDAYRIAYPEASVADVRNYTLDAIKDAVNVFGGQSMLVANDFFEEIARDAGADVETEFYDTFDFDKASSKVHYLAKSIVDGDIETFNGKVQDLTGFYVKREAFENLYRNCKKNGVRYARVPSGRETCAFCFILASRGFVYWSEDDAGGAGHAYHSNCDCIIVPGFSKDSGIDEDSQIEGYKPSELRERYKKCYNAINPNGTWEEVYEEWKKSETDETWEKFKSKALVKEIKTRDWGWLWSNKHCVYDKEKGGKPRKKEEIVSKLLTKQGFNVTAIKEINKSNIKTPDAYIQGKKWEYKIFEGWSKSKEDNVEGEQTVRRAFWQAEKKAKKLVVSNTENNVNYHELWVVTKKVFETGGFNINEVLIVGKDGELTRLKK